MVKNKTDKMRKNTQDEYDNAMASDDPTKIQNDELQNLAKESIKKFKSLS